MDEFKEYLEKEKEHYESMMNHPAGFDVDFANRFHIIVRVLEKYREIKEKEKNG